jgi:putative ABC transport system permease protein
MIRNYLKIAWRNILRNKISSGINIIGLAIGMSSFIMILLFVQDELKFDKFLEKSDRIYQVALNAKFLNGEEIFIGKTPASVSSALSRNFPEIENSARVYRPGDLVVRSETPLRENYFTETSVIAVDSNFLDIFSFNMLAGNRSHCLLEPNSIVITEKIAEKYFSTGEALGKTLFLGRSKKPFKVTGVLSDLPSQSTLQFDILTSTAAFPIVKQMSWSWVWLQVCTYVKLKDNVPNSPPDLQKLEAKFPAMIRTEAASAFKRVGQPFDELIKKGGKWDLHLQPFTDIHLYSANIGQILTTVSDIKYVYIFSIIALFIIILACVNFMNISTAQSSKRAKEVGVRKVLGSEKKQLIAQFLTEAMLFSLTSSLIALLLVAFLLEPFNSIAGKEIHLNALISGNIWLYSIGLILVTGLFAGSYPAFYLSSFKPAVVIKGIKQIGSGLSDFFIRNSLVVFQFTVSTALIICTIIVYKQLDFMRTKDLGLQKENIIIIKSADRLGEKQEAFKNELAALPQFKSAGIASGVPTRGNFGDGYIPEVSTPGETLPSDIGLSSFMVDENFLPTLNIQILKGRNFSKEFSDSTSVILNEAAAKTIGWKNPLGSYLSYPGNNNQRFKVIAVVKDFNTSSLHNQVEPFALFHTSSKTYNLGTTYILAKSKPGNVDETLATINEKWKAFAPAMPLDIAFLDEEFDALYKTEKRLGSLFFIFTFLAIFVACLGLLGLAIYSAERRTKEIGVRKVLGAPVQTLVTLLTKDFLKLVLIASVIAFPFAWWAMNKWLQDFAYKIEIEWWIFALAALISITLTIITVSWQTIKAAGANPVKSLRTE